MSSAVLLVLFTGTLVLLPYGMGYGLKRWILDNGGNDAAITDIDFNPFTGTLELYGLEIEAGASRPLLLPRLDLHLSWWPLWRKEVVVDGITVHGLRLAVDRSETDELRVGGIFLDTSPSPPEAPTDAGWGFAIEELALVDVELTYRAPDVETRARIDEFRLSDLASFRPEQAAAVLLQGSVDDAPLTIQGKASPFAEVPRFEGTIRLDGLDLHRYAGLAAPDLGQLQGRLGLNTHIGLSYGPQTGLKLGQDGTLSVNGAIVSAAQGTWKGAHLGWKGQLTLSAAAEGGPLDIVTQGDFTLGPGLWTQGAQGPRIGQQALRWQGQLRVNTARDDSEISAQGKLAVEALHLAEPAQDIDLSQGSLQWQGRLGLSTTAVQTRGEADGGLEAGDLDGTVDTLSFSLAAIELRELALDLDQTADGMKVVHQGTLAARGLALEERGDRVTHQRLQWKGRVEVHSPRDGPLEIQSQGALGSRELGVQLQARDTGLSYQALDWEGRLTLGVTEGVDDLQGSGVLTMKGLHSNALSEHYNILAFDELQARPIEIQGPEQLAVGEIDIDRLTLGRAEEHAAQDLPGANVNLFRSGRLAVKALEFSRAQGLRIASIEEHDVQSLTWRDREGNWNVVGLIQALERLAEGPEAEKAREDGAKKARESSPPASVKALDQDHDTESGFPVRVGRITVTGDSHAVFMDDSLEPPFKQTLALERGELRELDSTRPEHLSPLEAEGTIGRDAEFHLSGGVAPFAPRLTLDIQARIEGLPLPPLSSYTASLIGYRMDSGEVDADIKLQARAGKIKGDNRLELHQLTVSRLSAKELKALGIQATVPLDTSLAMLRDRNNTIKLRIPLSGDIEKLEVHPGDIINKALTKGLETGAKTYLAAALFPFGTALVVAQVAGEQALKVRLDPVVFAPGMDTLDAQDQEYLDKVAKLLQDRPEINIRLCGVATEADRATLMAQAEKTPPPAAVPGKDPPQTEEAQGAKTQRVKVRSGAPEEDPPRAQNSHPAAEISEQTLRQLATRRAYAVDDYLHGRSGIKRSRLVDCRPKIEKKDTRAKPRTELLI